MSSDADRPLGHAGVVEGLWRAARDGRLSHALGFFGPAGVGKFLSARWFARGLFCAEPEGGVAPAAPCGRCGPCKRVRSGTHPDLFVLDPIAEGLENVPIARIADRDGEARGTVEEFLRLKPAEGGYRVVLLRDFDRAVPQAQNALLKTLEEPGASVCLVLESSSSDRLLGTVRSRVVNVPFERLARDETERALAGEGLGMEDLADLARWSRGAPGRALELARFQAPAVRAILVRALDGEDPHRCADELGALKIEFPGDTPTRQARARARFVIDLALELLGDLARASAGVAPDALAHGELCGDALDSAPGSALRAALDAALSARQDVDMNLAPDAATLRTVMGLSDLARARSGAAGARR